MVVRVPDLEGPVVALCWAQAPNMERCDRRKGHLGPHSWESVGRSRSAIVASGLGVGSVTLLLFLLARALWAQDLTTELAFFLRDLRNMQSANTTTVDGATTFATTATYVGRITLACTGAETINTITGAVAGTRLYIHNTDTDCTLADDDADTAANAIDLTGTATNDVGAAKKVIVLLYNGTDWEQIGESDN